MNPTYHASSSFVAWCELENQNIFRQKSLPSSPQLPVDNPVATSYGEHAYPWTNNINWSHVVSISDFGGSLEKTQDAVVKAGGGVVYIPAGELKLTKSFTIASNVALRGVSDVSLAKQGKQPGKLAPKSKIVCPDRMHIGLFNNDPRAENIAIINLHLDGCAIMLWPALGPGPLSLKNYWYKATSIYGMGKNKIVWGNVVENVNYAGSDPDAHESDGWPWKFSTAIAVYSDNNTLIANNLLPQASSKATMKLSDGTSVPYPYDNRYGIDVNRVLLGGVFGKFVPGASPGHCTDAKSFEWSFRRGLVIRDNYVFGNGRVGVSFSGGGDGKTKGSGTQVLYNHVEHEKNGVFYGFDPSHQPHGSDTNENRGYDQTGIENNVTGNTGHIYRQQIFKQPYMTVDGEGILVQCSNGNNQYRNIWSDNDLSGGASGYIAYYNVAVVSDCDILNNVVNSDQHIGLLDSSNSHVSGIQCSGNTPKAQCNTKSHKY
eukprot:UC4_evm1s1147